MATLIKGTTFASGDVITPAKLNNLVDFATISSIGTADILDGAVTQAKINSSVTFPPSGAVLAFAMTTAPTGWLVANGATISRATYAALFAAIGTNYGTGDGSTTFAIPDLRGYFVRGSGTNADGTAAGSFGAKQTHGFASHTHLGSANSAGSHVHTFTAPNGQNAEFVYYSGSWDGRIDGSQADTGNDRNTTNLNSYIQPAGSHSHTISITATGGTETRPANIAMLYCIKY